ncbi:hypothetical protein ABFG93_21870 (plasmid) [Pseudalkalibacillus hwajinpoensis]|uniref:hypothetical protein n=1 Tax=Guptibacillus hwajinpoensis TaxID=208199 RepID=UPI00325BCC57
MDSKAIASGIRRYKHQESSRTLLGFETLVVSAIVGFLFKSWAAFGLTFLLFVIVSFVPILTLIVSLAFSLFWAIIGIVIGMAFVGSSLL